MFLVLLSFFSRSFMRCQVVFVFVCTLASFFSSVATAQTKLDLWYHGAGNPAERTEIEKIVSEFNNSQSDWRVVTQSFFEQGYNSSVVTSAARGHLPDIVDVDLPILPNWVWQGYLQPLPIETSLVEEFLPSTIGRWNGELYSLGLWEAAIAIVGRRSVLDRHGIRIPTNTTPWTKAEFDQALLALQASGEFAYPLDLGLAQRGEWYSYAFGSFLNSFGGDLIDRQTHLSAQGSLNGPGGIAFGKWWQSLFVRDLVPGLDQSKESRAADFLDGRYALRLSGNWEALEMLAIIGEDLLILPPPDMGQGPVIGAGSWQFAVSSFSDHPDGAAAFIRFAAEANNLIALSDALGIIPPTISAAAETQSYGPDGVLAPFFDLARDYGRVRPQSPGYVVASKVFEHALVDIAGGADPKTILDAAADDIDADIKRNNGYSN
ncbi:extracellular solute-binding protein [Pseudophaeobacter sp.]|uniref:sugar ABC transporter substrate-binding protein n=1 Tax=Pseudophaeobacter sp. TaxID=1971739 RepID=UPI003296F233